MPPNKSRQPTPGERVGFNWEPVARRGCAWRQLRANYALVDVHLGCWSSCDDWLCSASGLGANGKPGHQRQHGNGGGGQLCRRQWLEHEQVALQVSVLTIDTSGACW